MRVLSFYRFYLALAAGIGAGLFLTGFLPGLVTFIGVRTIWYIIEHHLERRRIDRLFWTHAREFKEAFGPYGIRIVNQGEKSFAVRKELAEVFDPNPTSLKKTVEQLETMDALYSAGLRPSGDACLIHDLKLTYARNRLAAKESSSR